MKEDGIVDLTDLPPKRVRLTLSKNAKHKIFGNAVSAAGSQRGLSIEIGVPQSCISEYITGTCSPTLSTIWKIREYLLDRQHEDILGILHMPRNIRKIRAGRSPLGMIFPHFPIDFNNQKGAAFAMAFLSDGHIQKTKMRAEYTNYRPELIQSVIDSSKVLGRTEYYQEEKRVIFPSVVGFILHYGLGIPTGNKMESDPQAPAFLFKTSKEVVAAALKQIYDDEGTVASSAIKMCLGKWTQPNQFKHSPPRLLSDVKLLAENLGLDTCKPRFYKEFKVGRVKSQAWEMWICGRKNFELFKKRIGFNAHSKRERLERLLAKWIIWRSVARSIFSVSPIVNKSRYFTSKDIAAHLKIGEKSARKLIHKLQKDGLVIPRGKGYYGRIEYVITPDGWKFLEEVRWSLGVLGTQAPEWST
jgi:DNA-binding MarR family transcriptional regulator